MRTSLQNTVTLARDVPQAAAVSARIATQLDDSARPVLLAMSATNRPETALQRAAAFATRLAAPLVVVSCVPQRRPTNMLFPHRNLPDVTAQILDDRTLAGRLWRWCSRTTVYALPPTRVVVRQGHVSTCAAAIAKKLRAQLVVIPENDVKHGRDVTAVVEDSGVSVLVSRSIQPSNTVIAATDLTLDWVPVLRQGVITGRTLGAPVTFVHNIGPTIDASSVIASNGLVYFPVTTQHPPPFRRQREARLAAVAAKLGGIVETAVVDEVDTVAAILDVAKRQQADLVIVGHHRRSWLDHVFGEHVAAGLVDRAVRSVMVVPIAKDAHRGRPV